MILGESEVIDCQSSFQVIFACIFKVDNAIRNLCFQVISPLKSCYISLLQSLHKCRIGGFLPHKKGIQIILLRAISLQLQPNDILCKLMWLVVSLIVIKFLAGKVELWSNGPIDNRHIEGLWKGIGIDSPSGDSLYDNPDKNSKEKAYDGRDYLTYIWATVSWL